MPRPKIIIKGGGGESPADESPQSRSGQAGAKRRQFVIPAPDRGAGPPPKSRPPQHGRRYVVGPDSEAAGAGRSRSGGSGGGRADGGPRSGAPQPPKKAKGRRRTLRRVILATAAVLSLLLIYYVAVAFRTNAAIRHTKPDVLAALSHDAGPTNILMVGSDTREGSNSVIPGESKAGLADVIMVVQLRGSSARILSIPRDTKVKLPGYGDQKINASFPLGGPPMVVSAVRTLTGLPIHRFAEIDFEGFLRITDAVGGVKICPETAERDEFSGLDIKAGCQVVNGEQALAFVRSRHTELLENGKWVPDGTGDLGRIKRQQMFMGALMRKLKNPVTMTLDAWSLGPALGSAFITDPGFGPVDGTRAAIALVGGSDSMELVALPTVPASTRGIAFLEAKQPEAAQVLAHFREP